MFYVAWLMVTIFCTFSICRSVFCTYSCCFETLLYILLWSFEQTYPRVFGVFRCVQLWEIIQITCMKLSISALQCCNLCYSITSHVTLILFYHTFMSKLPNSIISHAMGMLPWRFECNGLYFVYVIEAFITLNWKHLWLHNIYYSSYH